MPNIRYIKNFTASCFFNNSEGKITKQFVSIPNLNPDEVIIRSINFYGAGSSILYHIWSNLTNDYIGSFTSGSNNPQTSIRINGAIPSILEFKIFLPTATGDLYIDGGVNNTMLGTLAIHMDFIKYKIPLNNG